MDELPCLTQYFEANTVVSHYWMWGRSFLQRNSQEEPYSFYMEEDIIMKLNKRHREKAVPYTRFLSLLMMHKMKEGYGDLTLYPTQVFNIRQWYLKLSNSLPMLRSKEVIKSGSFKAPTSSKIDHSKKRKKSSSAMDSNLSQPPVSTPVDTGMHNGDRQAAGGPTSLRVTSKARANPQLSSGASSIARQVEKDEASRIIKLEDLAKLMSSVHPSFKNLDSPEDDLIIIVDDSDEDKEADEVHATTNVETEDTSVPKSLSPSLVPTELKDLPSKFNELTEEVKGLKKQVHELEIELPRDLKEIPTKLEEFTKTITIQVASIQAKLKTLDALLSLLLNVTKALNKFAQVLDYASSKVGDQSVPSAGQADIMHGKHIKKDRGKKAISLEETEKESTNSSSNDDDETHVFGSMVKSSTTKKLKKFNFITEDGKHIHLTKEQINEKKKIKEETKGEAAKHEGEDPHNKLNDLANKKRKHADDIHDYFKANKGLKSSVQYEDHLPVIVLNEHVLGMIMFNSYHRRYFVTIKDLKDFSNTMLYTLQEIFFRCHQGLGLDDHARTFSSLLLAKVDKRNLNPLKHMRVIKQLRQ
nr:hypothetical protein [Tanacetum cinerariifolium]